MRSLNCLIFARQASRRRTVMIRRYVQNAGEVPPDEAYSLWQAEVYRCLRPLVDEWLGTGLNPDGSESPSTGDLFRTTRAVSAVLEYSKKHQARIKFTPGSTVPKLFIGEPHPFSDKWNDFFMEAAEEARRYFTALMASDWKAGLCQCRFERCSRYFLASRPRRSYRYGAFCCHEHQSLVSAGVCTSVRRARTAAQLIDLAAERLLKWRFDGPCWQNDANRKHFTMRVATASLGLSLTASKNFLLECAQHPACTNFGPPTFSLSDIAVGLQNSLELSQKLLRPFASAPQAEVKDYSASRPAILPKICLMIQ